MVLADVGAGGNEAGRGVLIGDADLVGRGSCATGQVGVEADPRASMNN
jgi:hypothetical protein